MSAMRILYLHQYFVSPESAGGTRSYELARRMVARGHDVTLVTSNAMMPPRWRELDRITETELEGIKLVVLPVRYANQMGYRERMTAFAHFAALSSREAMRRRADVVFATSTPLTIAVPGLVASLGQRIPMVFEVRDLWPELPIAMGALKNPLMRATARALEWLAYHGSARVVALSPGMADGVARRGIPREHIHVIPNACDVAAFAHARAQADAVRTRLDLPARDPLVLYAGTFGAINDVPWLVDVAAAAKTSGSPLRFAFVGDGAGRAELLARAQSRGLLGDRVLVLPQVKKREMPGLLGAATIATSLFMPLPEMEANSANKFFDALAAGTPLAINYGGWHAELLRTSGAGVTMPHHDPARAAAILHAFANDELALARARTASRMLATTRFDRDRLAAELERVLLDAASFGDSRARTRSAA
jgi:glycosyltransferase involved in cell wall biosynthesis